MKTGNLWNIFCRVIDNYGDIGVCWRLSVDLARRGERVRLWVDDASALRWMAPQGVPGVELRHWGDTSETNASPIGDILLETFGCEIPSGFIADYAKAMQIRGEKAVWINLEYLSAESFVERSHGLPSPVMTGTGTGLSKHFFYPGFTPPTGGLLREPDLLARQAHFDRAAWLQQFGIKFQGERLISLFCYEPPALAELLDQLAADSQATRLLVTTGRAAAAVRACLKSAIRQRPGWNPHQTLSITYLPALTQIDFDHLLWACDLNFVRGEDSLVRALWADKPFVWQLYPQHDAAHHDKLEAFLNLLNASPSLRAFHQVWNGVQQAVLPALTLAPWQQTVNQARAGQLQQEDLVSRLMRFALKNH